MVGINFLGMWPLYNSQSSFSSVQLLSCVWLFVTPWTAAHQLPLLTCCPSPTPIAYSHSCPSCWWCHPTVSHSVVPFFHCLQSFPASGSFQVSQFFTSGGQVLEFQLQHQPFQWTLRISFKDGLVGSPCSPRDYQESSPTPQFKSINSLALSFLYSPTLTSIHGYWKNHSLDYTDLCWQSNASAFLYSYFISTIKQRCPSGAFVLNLDFLFVLSPYV